MKGHGAGSQPGILVGQHYEVTIRGYFTQVGTHPDTTLYEARMKNSNNQPTRTGTVSLLMHVPWKTSGFPIQGHILVKCAQE